MPTPSKKNAKPVSLNPLTPEEALAGLMKVKPEKEDNMLKIGDVVEVMNDANRDVIGKVGTITDIRGAHFTVSFNPAISPTPGVVITFIEATETQLKQMGN